VPVPENLRKLFERPASFEELDPTLDALREALMSPTVGAHGV